jgi:PAS domain-containing protein
MSAANRKSEANGNAGRIDPTDEAALDRLLVETVRDYAIFRLDRDGYIQTWNAGAERIKGYTPDEIGRPAIPLTFVGMP